MPEVPPKAKLFEAQNVMAAIAVGSLVWGLANMSSKIDTIGGQMGDMKVQLGAVSSQVSGIPNPDPRVAELVRRFQENQAHDTQQDSDIGKVRDQVNTVANSLALTQRDVQGILDVQGRPLPGVRVK